MDWIRKFILTCTKCDDKYTRLKHHELNSLHHHLRNALPALHMQLKNQLRVIEEATLVYQSIKKQVDRLEVASQMQKHSPSKKAE